MSYKSSLIDAIKNNIDILKCYVAQQVETQFGKNIKPDLFEHVCDIVYIANINYGLAVNLLIDTAIELSGEFSLGELTVDMLVERV